MTATQIMLEKTSPELLCFNNPIIIERILRQTSWDSMANLSFRLINQTFNVKVLRWVRQNHKTIELASPDQFERTISNPGFRHRIFPVYRIHVNLHVVPTHKIFRYFKFLTEVAKVKLTELRAKHLWIQSKHSRRDLHDEILELIGNQTLKVFTGMEGLCQNGCSRCERLAFNAREYGPIQMDFLTTLRLAPEPRHYQKLIVNEPLLDYIASTCIRKSRSQQECMSVLQSLITPHITCDELCLEIWENYDALLPVRHPSVPLPKEIIDLMISVWNVKSLKIRFDYYLRKLRVPDDLPAKLYFTEIRLDRFENSRSAMDDGKKRMLKSVEIDMWDTCHVYKELFEFTDQIPSDSYAHLVGNVRKWFPSRQILVRGPPKASERQETTLTQENFENMLETAWQEGTRRPDVDITFQFFASINNYKTKLQTPPEYLIANRELFLEPRKKGFGLTLENIDPMNSRCLVTKKFIGRAIRYVDEKSKTACTIDLLMDKQQVYRVYKRANGAVAESP